jgi:hypothetical protein
MDRETKLPYQVTDRRRTRRGMSLHYYMFVFDDI